MQMTRRGFLNSTVAAAALGVAGCELRELLTFERLAFAEGAVDIHAHIFNALDVPAAQFAIQVFVGLQAGLARAVLVALGDLLVDIATIRTKDAREEFQALGGTTPQPNLISVLADDEARVAAGIARYYRREQRAGQFGITTFDAKQSASDPLIDQLEAEFGTATGSFAKSFSADRAENRGVVFARNIYARSQVRSLADKAGSEPVLDTYIRRSTLAQYLRWFGLVTRNRADILAEYKHLYSRPGASEIKIVSPSLVDMDRWLGIEDDGISEEDNGASRLWQVRVMSQIARIDKDMAILNFVPFCPLRAALERDDGRGGAALSLVQQAIEQYGFAGVKLYPPMGFRAIGNENARFPKIRAPKGGGAALDVELRALYQWCNDNDVPIKAHANDSVEASPNAGENASPVFWEQVLEEYPNLRINLAHFGGFEETKDFSSKARDWDNIAEEIARSQPNLYFDFGHRMEFMRPDLKLFDMIKGKFEEILATPGNVLADRLMFGTDFTMIGRLPDHEPYLTRSEEALEAIGLKERLTDIQRDNALRFLGLDRGGASFQRLRKFFPEDHPFTELVEPV